MLEVEKSFKSQLYMWQNLPHTYSLIKNKKIINNERNIGVTCHYDEVIMTLS